MQLALQEFHVHPAQFDPWAIGCQVAHAGATHFWMALASAHPRNHDHQHDFQRLLSIDAGLMIEGSLEVKLPTIWTNEEQRWEELGKRREEERRSKRQSLRRKKIQAREKVGKPRRAVFFQGFVGRPPFGPISVRASSSRFSLLPASLAASKASARAAFSNLLSCPSSQLLATCHPGEDLRSGVQGDCEGAHTPPDLPLWRASSFGPTSDVFLARPWTAPGW